MPCYVQLGKKKKGVIVGERGRRQKAAQTRVSHHANATRSSSTRGSRYGSMTPRQPELTSRDDHRWTLSCTHTSSHWGSKHGKPPQYRVPPHQANRGSPRGIHHVRGRRIPYADPYQLGMEDRVDGVRTLISSSIYVCKYPSASFSERRDVLRRGAGEHRQGYTTLSRISTLPSHK